ncbi:aromatic peroxygenase [Venturia nashicola]|uniref:Aromatic peroxygenase n=1 Tax=Venturia nashicola TaxID=86259 RepID=A0A4Z1NTK9_9PEZI|nr:aromatic peroxygenase [Venturia nashicola]TLD19443.1 aromatic peroxygenase [Venturia nashicola]
MKLHTIASLVAGVNAFPYLDKRRGFDASEQCFDLTSGEHKFFPPGPKDLRGPCPGLNALANHNYIPHNGIASFQQLVDAQQAVFSVGNDIRHLLSAYGIAMSGSGDINLMSIGGPPSEDLAPLTVQLKHKPLGLGSEHVAFESDASPTRGDLYTRNSTKDVEQVILENFAQLYEKQDGECPGSANYDNTVMGLHRVERVKDSIARNSDFFLSAFGAIANGAAHHFIFELMANHTAENPDGIMDPVTLATMFAVEVCDDRCDDEVYDKKDQWHHSWHGRSNKEPSTVRDSLCHRGANHGHPKCPKDDYDFKPAGSHGHKYKYKVGHDRIPDYWCKRPTELTVALLNKRLIQDLKDHPTILQHMNGGNTQGPNTFKQLDISKYTDGVYPDYDFLLQDNNFACLGLNQAVFDAKGTWLDKMYVNGTEADELINAQTPLFEYLGCPTPKGPFWVEMLEEFRGFRRSQSWELWLG